VREEEESYRRRVDEEGIMSDTLDHTNVRVGGNLGENWVWVGVRGRNVKREDSPSMSRSGEKALKGLTSG